MAISDRQIICHAGRQLAGCSALFNELFLRLIPEGIDVAFGFTGRFPKKIGARTNFVLSQTRHCRSHSVAEVERKIDAAGSKSNRDAFGRWPNEASGDRLIFLCLRRASRSSASTPIQRRPQALGASLPAARLRCPGKTDGGSMLATRHAWAAAASALDLIFEISPADLATRSTAAPAPTHLSTSKACAHLSFMVLPDAADLWDSRPIRAVRA